MPERENDIGFVDHLGREPLYRSDGGKFIAGGWVCMCISAIFWIYALVPADQTVMGEIDPASARAKLIVMILAAALSSTAFALLGLGYIVRAIYFLPGDAMKLCDDAVRADAKADAQKAWEKYQSKIQE